MLLKREDLNHTGSHKINNVLGQALLADAWASAGSSPRPAPANTVSPRPPRPRCFGMECVVYMGEVDIARQALNVFRMKLLGAEVATGGVGQPHAEGRRQRGDARLGRHGRDHALLPGLGDGPASVPVDGARVPPRHRRRGARPVRSRPRRGRPRRRGRVRRRRLQRHRHLLRLRRHHRRAGGGRSRPAAPRSVAACRASCTARSRTCCRTSGAR